MGGRRWEVVVVGGRRNIGVCDQHTLHACAHVSACMLLAFCLFVNLLGGRAKRLFATWPVWPAAPLLRCGHACLCMEIDTCIVCPQQQRLSNFLICHCMSHVLLVEVFPCLWRLFCLSRSHEYYAHDTLTCSFSASPTTHIPAFTTMHGGRQ